jgi:hypothetical protein
MLWMGINIQQSHGEQMKVFPDYGDYVMYYDMNDQGEILEIDYGTQQGRILGKIEWNLDDPLLLLAGWVLNGQYVYLLNAERGFYGRLYLYSLEHATLQKTSVFMDLAGDSAFLPISDTTSYIQYIDSRTQETQRFVFNTSEYAVSDVFAFDVRPRSIYVVSDDKNRMFLAHPWSSQILEIDFLHHEIVSRQDVAHIVNSNDKNERVFVTTFHDDSVLIKKNFLKENTVKFYLMNLSDMQVFAESEQMPFFSGKYSLNQDDKDLFRISCVVEIVEEGLYKPTGTIQHFIVQKEKIVPIESIEYHPETEIALRENDGEFKIFPKYSFDYLSVFTIRKEVFSQMPGRFTPDAIPFAKQLIQQIREEFYTNPNREQRKALEIVE